MLNREALSVPQPPWLGGRHGRGGGNNVRARGQGGKMLSSGNDTAAVLMNSQSLWSPAQGKASQNPSTGPTPME